MKRFKELDIATQKKAVKFLYGKKYENLHFTGAGESEAVKKRLKEITERIQFCGCTDCDIKLFAEMKADSVIKEAMLDAATKQAEEAYYQEDNDIVLKF